MVAPYLMRFEKNKMHFRLISLKKLQITKETLDLQTARLY